MKKPMIDIAVLGLGTVGNGVYEVIAGNGPHIARSLGGEALRIKRVLDLRTFDTHPLRGVVTNDFACILGDPDIRVVVETMGGLHPAYEFSKAALESGRSVVTSNKAVVEEYGRELTETARQNGVYYLYEAAVGGGIPLISTLHGSFGANGIRRIAGILNGTTNFMLTKMAEEGMPFADALALAQELGYAERDPSADIEGHDSCRKICILASLAFGRHVYPSQVYTQGISTITSADVRYAAAWGGVIKLIGIARKLEDGRLHALVAPMLLPGSSLLADVNDVFNGIMVRGDAIGDVVFYGRGAGKLPTASAVVADVIDEVKHLKARKYQFWEPGSEDYVVDYRKGETAMLLRLHCTDAEAAFAQAQQLFGEVQRLHADGETAQDLAFVTPVMPEERIDEQIAAFTDAKVVSRIRVADF